MDPLSGIDAMFNAINMNAPPFSSATFSNLPTRRAWTRRRPHQGRSSYETPPQWDATFPDAMRDHHYFGSQPFVENSRITELDEFESGAVPPPIGYTQPRTRLSSPYQQQTTPSLRAVRSLTFAEAARCMHAALVCANQECRSIETSFNAQTRQIQAWLPAAYVNSLWTIRLSWTGRPEHNSLASAATSESGCNELATYLGIVQRFNTALTGIRTCTPPDGTGVGRGNSLPPNSSRLPLGWEVLGSTMRKLQISLEAIEELFALVKTQRDRMPLLFHEIDSAQHLLESVREVWETEKKAGKRPEAMASSSSAASSSSSSQFSRQRGNEWSGFSSVGNDTFDDMGIEI